MSLSSAEISIHSSSSCILIAATARVGFCTDVLVLTELILLAVNLVVGLVSN